jgi:RNA polymerase sigma-70 factor, ECF subfamily
LLALDNALEVLAVKYPRKAQVVELRFFGGLTVTGAAAVLKVDDRTVKRDCNLLGPGCTSELMAMLRNRA